MIIQYLSLILSAGFSHSLKDDISNEYRTCLLTGSLLMSWKPIVLVNTFKKFYMYWFGIGFTKTESSKSHLGSTKT